MTNEVWFPFQNFLLPIEITPDILATSVLSQSFVESHSNLNDEISLNITIKKSYWISGSFYILSEFVAVCRSSLHHIFKDVSATGMMKVALLSSFCHHRNAGAGALGNTPYIVSWQLQCSIQLRTLLKLCSEPILTIKGPDHSKDG